LFITIAAQLAHTLTTLKSYVSKAIAENPDIFLARSSGAVEQSHFSAAFQAEISFAICSPYD
jgi:hypothetical protein